MTWLYLIFFLIQLIGYPIVFIKLIRGLYKGNDLRVKKYTIRLVLLLVFSGLVFEKLPGSSLFWWPIKAIESKSYTKSLTGTSFVLNEAQKEWKTERDFNGDGYSIEMIPLDIEEINYFKNPDKDFFTQYPSSEMRSEWQTKKWNTTPILEEDLPAFDFINGFGRDQHRINLRELVNEAGNYYAYNIKRHSEDYIGNVDFYIICPERGILVLINFNT